MGRAQVIPFPPERMQAAKDAGLRYVSDNEPGIRRVKTGRSFRYMNPDGSAVRDEATLQRIRSLVIPPAWTDVWICRSASGHLQAVGRDVKGRKQYRYHPEYRQHRDQTKYGRMLAFGKALTGIRERVDRDLNLPGMPREKVLATVVRLLETTCMRIGNDEYREQNNSYGLTTLQDNHVHVQGACMRFRFRGKSGQEQDISLCDPKLARIVKRSRDIPGYELFQYYDEEGNPRDVTSSDVNDYIREVAGEDFTAKDFRTWGGTGWAALIFEQLGPAASQTEAKKKIVAAIKEVAQRLGNRPATCRKYYVHPAVLDAYIDGSLFEELKVCRGDRRQEECVMRVVTRHVESVLKDLEKKSAASSRLRKLPSQSAKPARRRAK